VPARIAASAAYVPIAADSARRPIDLRAWIRPGSVVALRHMLQL
jgi:hypothetical protein